MRPALQRLPRRIFVSDLESIVSRASAITRASTWTSSECRFPKLPKRQHVSLHTQVPSSNPSSLLAEANGNDKAAALPSQVPRPPEDSFAIQCIALAKSFEDHDEHSSWFEAMSHESAVNKPGRRMVDNPQFSHDFGIWAALLRFRRRIRGTHGVKEVWEGMRMRNIVLPGSGSDVDFLWNSFIRLGLDDSLVLEDIHQYAVKAANEGHAPWLVFYETVVGQLLEIEPLEAYKWHERLKNTFPPSPEAWSKLALKAASRGESLEVFRAMFEEIGNARIYNILVPKLCALENFRAAHQWHKILMQRKDRPSNSAIVEPLMHHLALYGDKEQLKGITKGLFEAGVPFRRSTSELVRRKFLLTQETMNELLGDVFSIRPKQFSDSFCARLFATKSVSMDFVINGLQLLGYCAIGPLSIREVAMREDSPSAISHRINQMAGVGIALGSSRYARVIKKLAQEGNTRLLHEVLQSDVSPETLENWKSHESVLASYADAQDWTKYNRTMAVLTLFSKDRPADELNIRVREHLSRRDFAKVKLLLDEMHTSRISVATSTIACIVNTISSDRQLDSGPADTTGDQDCLSAAPGILMSLVRNGAPVRPTAWINTLRALGKAGRLDDLEQLALWLVSYYSPGSSTTSKDVIAGRQDATGMLTSISKVSRVPPGLSLDHPSHPLRIIFAPAFQRSVITWGFISGPFSAYANPAGTERSASLGANELGRLPWTRGLSLLQALRKHGVAIDVPVIRRAWGLRLLTLFGEGRSTQLLNRQIKSINKVPMETMITDAERIWGPGLGDSAIRLLLPTTAGLDCHMQTDGRRDAGILTAPNRV